MDAARRAATARSARATPTLAFVEAMHALFIVTAIITALGIPLALMLRSGPGHASGGAVVAPH